MCASRAGAQDSLEGIAASVCTSHRETIRWGRASRWYTRGSFVYRAPGRAARRDGLFMPPCAFRPALQAPRNALDNALRQSVRAPPISHGRILGTTSLARMAYHHRHGPESPGSFPDKCVVDMARHESTTTLSRKGKGWRLTARYARDAQQGETPKELRCV